VGEIWEVAARRNGLNRMQRAATGAARMPCRERMQRHATYRAIMTPAHGMEEVRVRSGHAEAGSWRASVQEGPEERKRLLRSLAKDAVSDPGEDGGLNRTVDEGIGEPLCCGAW
jgi:hypothetical protein